MHAAWDMSSVTFCATMPKTGSCFVLRTQMCSPSRIKTSDALGGSGDVADFVESGEDVLLI
jgi:hypothetical protein